MRTLRVAGYTTQENFSEVSGRGLIGNLQQPPFAVPKVIVQRVMDHHADEGAHDDRRLNLYHGTVTLPLAYVGAQKFVNPVHEFFPEHLCQLVILQRRMQQQSLELRIKLVLFQRIERQSLKDRAVILARQRIGDQ